MSIAKELFGKMPDGEEVYAYTLQNEEGVRVKIITYGGAIVELYVPDRTGAFRDVVGGYDSLESYLYGDGYQGALIGRFGNRIAEGKFTLEGKDTRFTAMTAITICMAVGVVSMPSFGKQQPKTERSPR